MFSCFPQSAQADAEMQLRGYLAAVQDAELEDVEAAIRRFIRGEAKMSNAQFCPSSAQLSIEVRERRLMRDLMAKRASLGASSSPPRSGGEVARRSRDGEGSTLREIKAG
ncbi:hypothetical protein DPM33_26680 [Mesorhizobium hawassense]|uniref:Uncharacterized protein n=2 Tax=Mesorhizobium hawassense TaxID=1209954 RepID=A0A330HFQ4_9HYPH|nr:hypothetical protein DPM33_26680 [Mesorhizobium hawassense]